MTNHPVSFEYHPPSEDYRRVIQALTHAADRIAETNSDNYCRMLKRGKDGRLTQTYALTEAHQRVLAAQWAFLRGYIDAETAMGVLVEHEVFQERFGVPGLVHSLRPRKGPVMTELSVVEEVARQSGWVS